MHKEIHQPGMFATSDNLMSAGLEGHDEWNTPDAGDWGSNPTRALPFMFVGLPDLAFE